MSTADWIVAAVLIAAIAAAVLVLLRRKKRGASCCGDCSSCRGCAQYNEEHKVET